MRQEEKIEIQELLMGVSHAYFVKIYHQLKQIGIHPGQLPIIKLLDFHDGLSQKEIAGKLFLSAPTVTSGGWRRPIWSAEGRMRKIRELVGFI